MIKIRRNFKRSGGKPQGTKKAQKQRNLFSYKNFAAKRAPHAKIGFPYEIISQPGGHFVAHFAAAKLWCEAVKWP